MADTVKCERCGREVEQRTLKEVAWEEDTQQVRKMVCPNCLDELMNQSDQVRGIAGQEKAAAAHLDPPPGGDAASSSDGAGTDAERESFGRRE